MWVDTNSFYSKLDKGVIMQISKENIEKFKDHLNLFEISMMKQIEKTFTQFREELDLYVKKDE